MSDRQSKSINIDDFFTQHEGKVSWLTRDQIRALLGKPPLG